MGAQQHQVLPGRPSSRPGPACKAFTGPASNNAFKTTKDECGGEKASIKAALPVPHQLRDPGIHKQDTTNWCVDQQHTNNTADAYPWIREDLLLGKRVSCPECCSHRTAQPGDVAESIFPRVCVCVCMF